MIDTNEPTSDPGQARQLLMGDEAVALGALHAGVVLGTATVFSPTRAGSRSRCSKRRTTPPRLLPRSGSPPPLAAPLRRATAQEQPGARQSKKTRLPCRKRSPASEPARSRTSGSSPPV